MVDVFIKKNVPAIIYCSAEAKRSVAIIPQHIDLPFSLCRF